MMTAKALILATALAASPAWAVAQSSYPELEACALGPFGTEGACTASDAYDALQMIEPEWGYRLRASAGVDAFAIVWILGELRSGLEAFGAGDCALAEEIAYSASETWTWYVSPSDDMTDQGAVDLAAVQGFVNQTVGFLSKPRRGWLPMTSLCQFPGPHTTAILVSLLTPAMALADCIGSEQAFLGWLAERYGPNSAEVRDMRDGSVETQWGLAAATYISMANAALLYATEESLEADGPYELKPDLGEYAPSEGDLAELARLLMLSEDVATCLRPDGRPMIIGDQDMGAQFDDTHPDAHRAAIRAFAESLL